MANPKRRLPQDLRSLARSHTASAISTLAGIMRASEYDAARVSAAIHLLDRGWGKAEQVHSGDVNGEIRITIRKIIEGHAMKTIDHE